jgi:hypothetical protein
MKTLTTKEESCEDVFDIPYSIAGKFKGLKWNKSEDRMSSREF